MSGPSQYDDDGVTWTRVAECDGAADLVCPCGERVHLFFNGGEMDGHKCTCGRYYRNEATGFQVVVATARPRGWQYG